MKTLNSIAVEHLLRNDSQKNNKSEEIIKEILRPNQEQDLNQKSLLFQLYYLEEEGEDFFA